MVERSEYDTRAEELAKQARVHFDQGHTEEASRAIYEAMSLSKNNSKVQHIYTEIQRDGGFSSVLQLCRKFATWNDQNAGKEAFSLVQNSDFVLSSEDTEKCMELLWETKFPPSSVHDDLFSQLTRRPGARRYLTRVLKTENITETLIKVQSLGHRSTHGVVSLLLDPVAWDDEDTRMRCQEDVFLLLLAKLIEAGNAHDENNLKDIALLMAHNSQLLAAHIDVDCLETLLSNLDSRLPMASRNHATQITASYLRTTGTQDDRGKTRVVQYIVTKIAFGTDDERILAFSVAAAIFPMEPTIASGLFLTEGFVESLVKLLRSKSETSQTNKDLISSAFDMLSAACADHSCRQAVHKHALPFIEQWADDQHAVIDQVTSNKALVSLAKLSSAQLPVASSKGVTLSNGAASFGASRAQELVSRCSHRLISSASASPRDVNSLLSCVEALAYLSTRPEGKESLCNNASLLEVLVKLIPPPAPIKHDVNFEIDAQPGLSVTIFSVLTIIANITRYPRAQSEEQKRLAELKAYAESQKISATSAHDLNSPEAVEGRNTIIMATPNLVSVLISYAIPSLSHSSAPPSHLVLVNDILLALSQTPSNRGPLIQHGALRLNLPTPHIDRENSKITSVQIVARLLISVDPRIALGGFTSAMSAVAPLLSLLRPDSIPTTDATTGTRDLLPMYESLLALTNLASHSPDMALSIGERLFPAPLDTLLLHHHPSIQRAAVELVCNTACTSPVADAFSPSTPPRPIPNEADVSAVSTPLDTPHQKRQRLHILIALTDSEDRGTRSAAGGALAGLTGWESVRQSILDRNGGLDVIMRMIDVTAVDVPEISKDKKPPTTQNDHVNVDRDLNHRGFVILHNIVCAEGRVGKKGAAAAVGEQGMKIVGKAVEWWVEQGEKEGEEVLRIAVEILRAMKTLGG